MAGAAAGFASGPDESGFVEVTAGQKALLGALAGAGLGAVVGATHPAELMAVRQWLPEAWFLIPGYGAQGGTAAECVGGFRPDGLGAVVNSSRGVIVRDRAAASSMARGMPSSRSTNVTTMGSATPVP